MIVELTQDHVPAIAQAHLLAWQKAFRNILSNDLLEELNLEGFIKTWHYLLNQKQRTNLVWLNEKKEAVAFVSYGPPKAKQESADVEIYGLYVHPESWRKNIGTKLFESVRKNCDGKQIVLWVMKKNLGSISFYESIGMTNLEKQRLSVRKDEPFYEVKMSIQL